MRQGDLLSRLSTSTHPTTLGHHSRLHRSRLVCAANAPPGSALFAELVDRQFDSFGRLFEVPARFLLAALAGDSRRWRETALDAWPAIRADIDAGRPAMVGLVRRPGLYALARDFGHQVVAHVSESAVDR